MVWQNFLEATRGDRTLVSVDRYTSQRCALFHLEFKVLASLRTRTKYSAPMPGYILVILQSLWKLQLMVSPQNSYKALESNNGSKTPDASPSIS